MIDDDELELIRAIVQRITNTRLDHIDRETRISDLGIDSLLLAEVVVEIEETLAIEIEFGRWLGVRTVGDLLRMIDESVPHNTGKG
jgi:acyl carrier protein